MMAVILIDGKVRCTWAAALTNHSAPAVPELTAATDIQNWITPDGLDIKSSTSKVNASNLGSRKNAAKAGRVDYDVMITFQHQSASGPDGPWDLFPFGTLGFLVIREGIPKADAWAAGQRVRVYRLESGESDPAAPAPDGLWIFRQPFFVEDAERTDIRALVAA
jgi:hypothetical protein